MKSRLKRAIGETKLNFEEFATVITQIEACPKSRPLAPLSCDGDTIEPLTPGHFLIGRPLEALPDPPVSYHSISSQTLASLSKSHLTFLEEVGR